MSKETGSEEIADRGESFSQSRIGGHTQNCKGNAASWVSARGAGHSYKTGDFINEPWWIAAQITTNYPSFVNNPSQPTFTHYTYRNPQYPLYQVIHEPWWIAAQVAEVYAFKLNYDRKAFKLGLPPIALGEAVSALNYTRYGVVEVRRKKRHTLFILPMHPFSALILSILISPYC